MFFWSCRTGQHFISTEQMRQPAVTPTTTSTTHQVSMFIHLHAHSHTHTHTHTTSSTPHSIIAILRLSLPAGHHRTHPPQYRDPIMTDGLSHTWQHTQQISRCTPVLWAHACKHSLSTLLRSAGSQMCVCRAGNGLRVRAGAQVVEVVSFCNFLQTHRSPMSVAPFWLVVVERSKSP